MSTVEAQYLGDLCVDCTLTRTNKTIRVESRLEDFGKGETFSPTDLVATALGACAMNVMGIYAHKRGLKLEGTKVEISKTMEKDPGRIAKIDIRFTFPPNGFTEKDRKGLERCVHSCPVHNSLSEKMEQNFTLVWLDDESR